MISVQKRQLSLCRHYISCSKSHVKERLKRKALRWPWKTDIEGADVTCWADCSKYRQQQLGRPVVYSRVWWTFSDSEEADLGPEISHVHELVGKIWRCLNWVLSGALWLSQCSSRKSGVMWSYLDEGNTSCTAEFRTDWSYWRGYNGMPATVALS